MEENGHVVANEEDQYEIGTASTATATALDYPNLVQMPTTNQLEELQTILRDRHTDHSDFVFYADRLMRLVIEAGLNRLPFESVVVRTPTGKDYEGIAFKKGNCGVALCRSGEAMEAALRQCCKSIRIGKMLLGDEQRILYARFVPDVAKRRVLLLYPIMTTGSTVVKAILTLLDNDVKQENIIVLTLFATPASARKVCGTFSAVQLITSDVSPAVPGNFSTKYFGTD